MSRGKYLSLEEARRLGKMDQRVALRCGIVAHLRGKKRLYFSEEPGTLHAPLQLTHSALYVEGNFSANDCVRLARRVLTAVRGSDDGFRVEVGDPN